MAAHVLPRPRNARRTILRCLATGIGSAVGAALIAGCSADSSQPNSAGQPTLVPSEGAHIGSGSSGGINVTQAHVTRSGDTLEVSATVQSSETAPDQLLQATTQVSSGMTFQPPLTVAPGATVKLGDGGTPLTLHENARIDPGETVSLTLRFQRAGDVQVFSSVS